MTITCFKKLFDFIENGQAQGCRVGYTLYKTNYAE